MAAFALAEVVNVARADRLQVMTQQPGPSFPDDVKVLTDQFRTPSP